ncbi:MAG TPA: OmpA family protein, partial [Kofleriaceae bacterium]|nr:OmpA family protein [Kofleriaceae bacterium]
DDDGDGVGDAADLCPLVADPGQANTDGDALGDACDSDDDGDNRADVGDNCPLQANADQADEDHDGVGDVCDADRDGDGVLDSVDDCPDAADPLQVDLDGDGIGNACDGDSDADGDGVQDGADDCPLLANPDQANHDGDAHGDACDDDDDGDGVYDELDDCPTAADPGQDDLDGDHVGDACDDDDDGDGIADVDDDCPRLASDDQTDTDGDGAGDLCDDDDDDDGIADTDDNCPRVANADQADLEGDGIGDACDIGDDDGDGISDADEHALGTDPRDPHDFPRATGGGCDAGGERGGDGGGGAWLVPLFLGLWLERRRARRAAIAVLALAVIAGAGPRLARADGFDAEALRPGVVGRDGVDVEGSGTLAPFDSQLGVLFGVEANPIELSNGDGMRIAGVIDELSSLHLRGTLGLPAHLEAGVELPILMARGTDPMHGVSGNGVGDLVLSVKWSPRSRDHAAFGVALWPELVIPTGDEQALRGDGGLGGGLRLAIDRRFGSVVVVGTAGGRFRDGTRSYDFAAVGQQLTYGALVGWSPAPRWRLAVEGEGALGLGDGAGTDHAEALASAGLDLGRVSVLVGGGAGLNDAIGSPDWRAFAAFAYRYKRPHDLDLDDDGILNAADACPTRPEDLDGFQDTDGCPDDDNDGDGVADAADRCPLVAEDRDGFEDADGCPDDDNDGDGIADAQDACVDRPEDKDGFQDDDGCPDDDNDGDGIADAFDHCPLAAETPNQFEDDDGCPDQRPTYVFKAGESLVFTDIMFPTDKWDILPQSFPVLDEIVKSLQAQPWVQVRIEGHTDDVGKDAKNLVLSQQRALAVVNYLVGAGIDARRLSHAGYGETRPVAPNTDEANRAKNRRVELVTLDAAFPVPGQATPAAAPVGPTPPTTPTPTVKP